MAAALQVSLKKILNSRQSQRSSRGLREPVKHLWREEAAEHWSLNYISRHPWVLAQDRTFQYLLSSKAATYSNKVASWRKRWKGWYLHTFDIDSGADELFPDERGFGISTRDGVEDVRLHVHLLCDLHCNNKRHRKPPKEKLQASVTQHDGIRERGQAATGLISFQTAWNHPESSPLCTFFQFHQTTYKLWFIRKMKN